MERDTTGWAVAISMLILEGFKDKASNEQSDVRKSDNEAGWQQRLKMRGISGEGHGYAKPSDQNIEVIRPH